MTGSKIASYQPVGTFRESIARFPVHENNISVIIAYRDGAVHFFIPFVIHNFNNFSDYPQNYPHMIVYAVIATDSVAARGLVNGWCLPRSGRRDILSVAITAFIFIGVILRIII